MYAVCKYDIDELQHSYWLIIYQLQWSKHYNNKSI